MTTTTPPGTLYGDGTAGHQGAASEAGEPSRRRKIVEAIAYVQGTGRRGATSLEWEEDAGLGHGAASGALSNAHRAGYLVLLRERRRGYGVYVRNRHDLVMGRDTVPHRSNRPGATPAIDENAIRHTLTAWNVLGVNVDPITGHETVVRRVRLDALDALAERLIEVLS